MNIKSHPVQKFLQGRMLLALATKDPKGNPWICNVYFVHDEDLNMYFFSEPRTNHSQHVEHNPNVAFTVAWHDDQNLADRKAIQAQGVCRRVNNWIEVGKKLILISKKIPSFGHFSIEKMKKGEINVRLYKITPHKLKFWSDELYPKQKYSYIIGNE